MLQVPGVVSKPTSNQLKVENTTPSRAHSAKKKTIKFMPVAINSKDYVETTDGLKKRFSKTLKVLIWPKWNNISYYARNFPLVNFVTLLSNNALSLYIPKYPSPPISSLFALHVPEMRNFEAPDVHLGSVTKKRPFKPKCLPTPYLLKRSENM